MSKRTTFTTISPLPSGISRQAVLDFLHNHEAMIDLNPLVIERHPLTVPPAHCPEDERQCTWWSMTDKITYMPGIKSDLTYTAAFQDLKDGIRTHCYAPMGTHIRERWSLGGTLPGEPKQPIELGLGAPSEGLYIREDVEVRCNFLMAGFVKKTILKAHGVLCDRLIKSAETSGPSITSPLHSPSRTVFLDAYSASNVARSSSTHNESRDPYGDDFETKLESRRYSPPTHIHQHYQNQHNRQQSSGGSQSFYGHQRAAASETDLLPDYLPTGTGQTYTGQGWQTQQQKPYVHDPHNPYTQLQTGQTPTVNHSGKGQPGEQSAWVIGRHINQPGAPIAELTGSETHIIELQ